MGGIMKTTVLFLVLLTQLFPSAVQAAFYQWDDTAGVTHFTDNPDSIPSRYQKRAKKLNMTDQPAASREEASPAPTGGAGTAAPVAQSLGGQSESWWRGHFSALRSEQKALLAGLTDKQARLVELRRKRVIYMRAQDREAVNSMQAEISVDELRISELQKQIDDLDQQATRAAVPVEWRQ